MVILDLFPAAAIQFKSVLDHGLWFAHSNEFITDSTFESLTWMRSIGASVIFICRCNSLNQVYFFKR